MSVSKTIYGGGDPTPFDIWWKAKGIPDSFRDLALSAYQQGIKEGEAKKDAEWLNRLVTAYKERA